MGIFGFYCQIGLSELTVECTTKIEVQEQCIKCRHMTKENELQHCWFDKLSAWFECGLSLDLYISNQFQCTMPSFRCSHLDSHARSNLSVFSKLLRLSYGPMTFLALLHGPHIHKPRLVLHTHQSSELHGQKA